MTEPLLTDDQIVEKYISIRDAKKLFVKKHEENLAKFDGALAELSNLMLRKLNARNAESTKTAFGTAYKTRRISCTMEDRAKFLDYVIDHSNWSLITNHISKEAVEDIITLTGSPPPGVSYTAEIVVQVRKG